MIGQQPVGQGIEVYVEEPSPDIKSKNIVERTKTVWEKIGIFISLFSGVLLITDFLAMSVVVLTGVVLEVFSIAIAISILKVMVIIAIVFSVIFVFGLIIKGLAIKYSKKDEVTVTVGEKIHVIKGNKPIKFKYTLKFLNKYANKKWFEYIKKEDLFSSLYTLIIKGDFDKNPLVKKLSDKNEKELYGKIALDLVNASKSVEVIINQLFEEIEDFWNAEVDKYGHQKGMPKYFEDVFEPLNDFIEALINRSICLAAICSDDLKNYAIYKKLEFVIKKTWVFVDRARFDSRKFKEFFKKDDYKDKLSSYIKIFFRNYEKIEDKKYDNQDEIFKDLKNLEQAQRNLFENN
jgi:hypothetical protein